MENKKTYLGKIASAIESLATGMGITGKEFFTPKVTECYPENRDTLYIFDRFKGVLEMPHDENGNSKCIACGMCQTVCPNDAIVVDSEMVEDEASGKKKKQLVKYEYDLGSCMYCNLCVEICPTDAIRFNTGFENAVFDRSLLNMTLHVAKAGTAKKEETSVLADKPEALEKKEKPDQK
ncbi:MAG: NADH-quinone oxidoreductase subunit I [Dysgonamonadaceae bacterium]|jgi:NADH-quinone oxidoreductase subunit I|nr:NADH-quinone oxidoreductase subunit I [Dysgonamonadaceae bacterium]